MIVTLLEVAGSLQGNTGSKAIQWNLQGDGIHYPVGHPLLGDGIPFLPASVTDKSWSEVLRLRVL